MAGLAGVVLPGCECASVPVAGSLMGGRGWPRRRRLVVTCCAADAQVLKVEMHGTPAPPADAWVTVTGQWRPKDPYG
ncbi:hypothetical protein ACFXJ5_40615 [Streptomyces sp. NPDC059373]